MSSVILTYDCGSTGSISASAVFNVQGWTHLSQLSTSCGVTMETKFISKPSHCGNLRQHWLREWALGLKEQQRKIREDCPLPGASAHHWEQSEFKCDIRAGDLWPNSFSKRVQSDILSGRHTMCIVGWKAQGFVWMEWNLIILKGGLRLEKSWFHSRLCITPSDTISKYSLVKDLL